MTGEASTLDASSQPAPSALKGLASWFCLPGRSVCTRGYPASGLYAAAGPALRVGDWRGRLVWIPGVVDGDGQPAPIRLIDWCACPDRLIDLYASVFAQLAPLSRGITAVEVRW